jgi:putative isomerase
VKYIRIITFLIFSACLAYSQARESASDEKGWEALKEEAGSIGKLEWRPMLGYVADLHQSSTHKAQWPFRYDWEEIGPGYHYGPAFGHWDIVHQTIDVMDAYPEHALHQLLNNIENQEPSGLIPGSIWMPKSEDDKSRPKWNRDTQGHPPLWVFAVDDLIEKTADDSILKTFYTPLIRQITWFENERKAGGEGFYYTDITLKKWESGVDEGIRFDDAAKGEFACIDATSHVYLLYQTAARWSVELGLDNTYYSKRAAELKAYIQNELYSESEGLFYDQWAMKDPASRTLAFETLFPVVVGAATQKQADRIIDEYVLDPTCFNTEHPLATVGKRDPKFELRMWRGPAWNSMTYWVARGCIEYGREDAALILLEKALDQSAKQFQATGKIWEFYHPLGGHPQELARKPETSKNEPCSDYLGHNPLIEMARLYEQVTGGDLNLNAMLSPVPSISRLQDKDYHIWGASMVRGPEGKYHLFYSRWPKAKGFSAWVTHSEIAHAVSDTPTGPYQHVDVALSARGADYWDGLCIHNPTIHRFGGKYYLYYMGNTGDGKNTKERYWTHRNNQRIGVAVSDHPNGPWKRFDRPLIDVGADDQAHDALMTSNPSICRRPDGTYLLIYKCAGKQNPLPFGGPVTHRVAISDSPTGPFKKLPDSVFTAEGDDFPAEDPFIWAQDQKFWAIVKDMHGAFTGKRKSLALFESSDGIDWRLAKHPLVTTPQLEWEGEGLVRYDRLERPQLWLNKGIPAVLFCAAKKGDESYNVYIPLAQNDAVRKK